MDDQSLHEWQPYTGQYRKQEYDIRLRDGGEVLWCWPNAGWFNQMCPPYESHRERDVTHIRYSIKARLKPEGYPWSVATVPATHPDAHIGENDKD